MSERDGSKGVIAQAVQAMADSVPAEAVPVQEELFNVPAIPAEGLKQYESKQGTVYTVDNTGLSDAELAVEADKQRKAGRPPGARNHATRDLRALLLASGVVPQTFMQRWLNVEPEQLAKRLGCSVYDAFKEQLRIASELGEYIIPKMARTDGAGNAVPTMALYLGHEGGNMTPLRGQDGRKPWDYLNAEIDGVVEAATEDAA